MDVPFGDLVIVDDPVPVLDAAAECVKLGDALVVLEDCLVKVNVGEEEDVFETRLDAEDVLEAVVVLVAVVDPVEVRVPYDVTVCHGEELELFVPAAVRVGIMVFTPVRDPIDRVGSRVDTAVRVDVVVLVDVFDEVAVLVSSNPL